MNERHTVGTVIDRRYRLKREIARGAAGIVYEAEHLYTKRPVALKLLTPAHLHVPESRLRLLREAEALALSRGPSIVQVLDAGELDDVGPYVVMELLEGRTLQGILAVRQRIGTFETVQVGRQLCEGLSAVHARGLLHRDIKPSNVFVAREDGGREVVKIFDFGIAKLKTEHKLTQHGAVLGTPEYMAPEQLLARDDLDARVDIYAVGVTLFECLTGAVPFDGNFGEVLLKTATQPLTPIRSKNPTVPSELAAAVEKAIAREPEDRYASMTAFAEALAQIAVPDSGGSLLGLRPPRPVVRTPQLAKLPAPPALPVDQRRRFPRAPYVTPVRIVPPSSAGIDCRSEDVSVGGLLVVASQPCPADVLVKVRFALPSTGRLVELAATTKWVRMARGTEAIGLQFTVVPADVHAEIDAYVRAMGGT